MCYKAPIQLLLTAFHSLFSKGHPFSSIWLCRKRISIDMVKFAGPPVPLEVPAGIMLPKVSWAQWSLFLELKLNIFFSSLSSKKNLFSRFIWKAESRWVLSSVCGFIGFLQLPGLWARPSRSLQRSLGVPRAPPGTKCLSHRCPKMHISRKLEQNWSQGLTRDPWDGLWVSQAIAYPLG